MWAGGKRLMIKHHAKYLPSKVDCYSEPFFGAGAMFMHVAKTYNPKKYFINDINPGIMNIYSSIKADPGAFMAEVDLLQNKYLPLSKPDRKKYYLDVRNEHAFSYKGWSQVKEAATLYFLLRTCFNGIWQVNKNTGGRFGTPAGRLQHTKSLYSKEVIMLWNANLTRAELSCLDYSLVPSGDLNYLDPPYLGGHTTYETRWDSEACLKVIEHADKMPGTVLLCNRVDDMTFFEKNKMGFSLATFPVTYTAGRRKRMPGNTYAAKKATEVLLYKTTLKETNGT
jgi:DNA adenine methylase